MNVLASIFKGYDSTLECTESALRHAISRIILEHLDNEEMTQKELSEASGIDQQNISRVLSTDHDYKLSSVAKLLHALKVNSVYIDTKQRDNTWCQ